MLTQTCRQTGQAMTEFVVVASLVLVPAFLLLPMIGKLVDMKQASVQAARYMAWEYTAWNASATSPNMLKTFNAVQSPVKSSGVLDKETARRIFSGSTLPIAANDAGEGWKQDTDNPVWSKPNGQPLYVYGSDTTVGYRNRDVPDPLQLTKGFATITSSISSVMSGMGNFLGVKNAKFDATQAGGYVTTDVTMPVAKVAELSPFDHLDLAFHAQAALVTRGWDAGGSKQTRSEVRGLVPTVFFDNPVFHTLLDNPVMKTVAPDISSDSLKFGYVDTSAVPPEYLNNGATNCDDKTGLCTW